MIALIRAAALFLLAYTLQQLMHTDLINLYINPRFVPLTKITWVLIIILFGLSIIDFGSRVLSNRVYPGRFTGAPVIVLLTALSPLIFSPQALGSGMISQKGMWTFGGSNPLTVLQSPVVQPDHFGSDVVKQLPAASKPEAVEEVMQLTDSNFIVKFAKIQRHPQDYIGKEIELEGFLVHHPLMDHDKYLIARYAIVCCAADAQVLGFAVLGQAGYPDDTWIKLRGKIAADQENLYLKVTRVQRLKTPANPYLYAPEGLPEI
ncbi:TIGR03943 family protein [bacterium BFN5]|nr:TIGR03943 family protein [bacterium BFN5]QJW45878.1 TIGR03943 family protein [bacterium BFN5]